MSPASKSQKKTVHYESDSKKHKSRSSRDSGIGSSSSASRSDRASSGSSAGEASFTHRDIDDQRYNIRALQEALDAANEKVARKDEIIASLNVELADSNKDRRSLRRHNSSLLAQVEELQAALEKSKKANEKQRRSSASPPSSPRSRYPPESFGEGNYTTYERPSSSRRTSAQTAFIPRDDTYRRPSFAQHASERTVPRFAPPPLVPQPPPNPASPLYPPGVSFSARSEPVYAPPLTRGDIFPNDGMYYPYPL